jgi:hypothetical protein
MKLVLELGGLKMLLTPAQVEAVTESLAGAEHIEQRYVGKDVSPTNYVPLISSVVMHDIFKVGVMDDATYGAMKLSTKLFHEKHGK